MNEDRSDPADAQAGDARGEARRALEQSYGKVRERLDDLLDGTPEAARGLAASARDYYRRGAAAIASTAGDNNALMLLGLGAVGAAAGWLWMRRRSGRKR